MVKRPPATKEATEQALKGFRRATREFGDLSFGGALHTQLSGSNLLSSNYGSYTSGKFWDLWFGGPTALDAVLFGRIGSALIPLMSLALLSAPGH